MDDQTYKQYRMWRVVTAIITGTCCTALLWRAYP